MKIQKWYSVWIRITFVVVLLALTTLSLVTAPKAHADGPVRIMPLGASITEGLFSSDGGGYRTQLFRHLRDTGYNTTFVGSSADGPDDISRNHEGHSGFTISGIANNVDGWLDQNPPDIILLHVGTNDLLMGADPNGAADQLNALIDRITAHVPNATLVIAQIIPVAGFEDQTQVYNAAIASIVQSKGDHVRLVNMYDVVPESELRDGVHPTDYGYDLMGDAWYQAVTPLLS